MTEEVNNNAQPTNNEQPSKPAPAAAPQPQQSQEESVSYDSYSKLLNQRKADQAKAKELEEKLNVLMGEKEAAERATLEEQGKYRELWEAGQKQLESLKQERAQEKQALINHKKLQAFKENVGQLANPAYASMIDLDKIKVDDNGDLIQESLELYGNYFKNTHPELLKGTKKSVPTQEAPQSHGYGGAKKPTSAADMLAAWKKQGGGLNK